MTDRPIYTIDLDDSAFQKFAQTFERFKAESAKVQSGWKANEKLVAAATENFKKMGADPTRGAHDQGKQIADAMSSWSSAGWVSIGSAAKLFSSNIRAATGFLAKWTGITSVVGSLISAGGIYGLTRLSQNVGARRSSAQQLGTTWGAQAAASGAFVSIPGASRIISGLSDATASQQGMAPLFNLMGGQAERLRGGDPVEAFVSILPHLKGLADQGGSWGSMNERMRAMGLDKLGVGVDTLRLLRAMKPGELQEMISTYRSAEPRMRLSERDQKAMQDFATAIEESETAITNAFGRNLVKLTPVVEKGVDLLTHVFEAMERDGSIAAALGKFDTALMAFGKWIDDPDFRQQATAYGEDIATIAASISQLSLSSLGDRIQKFNKYWNPFGVVSRGISGQGVGGSTGIGSGGGMTPGVPRAVGGSRSATGSGNQPGAITPSDHRPHLGPIPMPWTTPQTGGTTPRAASPGGTTTPSGPTGASQSGLPAAAVQDMMQLRGFREYNTEERRLIQQYLVSGGHGMDPAVTPWCAAAVSAAYARAGLANNPHGNGNWVPNWQDYGRGVDPSKESLQAGDLILFHHGPGTRRYHIGLATGRREGNRIEVMEGNTSDKADLKWESIFNKDVRRATENEILVKRGSAALAPTSSAPSLPGQSEIFLGDSLGVGMQGAAHGQGNTLKNRNPRDVLGVIKDLPAGALAGKDVYLSSGASNGASQAGLLADQIAAAREKGMDPSRLTVLGVGPRSDLAGVNEKLREQTQAAGASFQPLLETSGDKIHPKDYDSLLRAAREHRGSPRAALSQRTHPALQGQQSHVEVHDNSGGDGNIHVQVAQRGPLKNMPTMHWPGAH